jgi:hypothetical protein
LTKDGSEQFHLCRAYNKVNEVKGQESQKYPYGNASADKFVDLVQQDAHQADVDEINPGNFQEPHFEKKDHTLQM